MRRSLHTRLIRPIPPLLMAIALIAATPGVASAAGGFGDVEDGRFYTDAVTWMVDASITTGIETGCFGPDDAVTRGQIAAFLFRLDTTLGNDPAPARHPFEDVTAEYQQEPVGWLYAAGITTGTGPTTFSPADPITRGDFAVMLWRYAGSPAPGAPHDFRDVTRAYQQDAVSWMADTGVTTGTSASTFGPDGDVTRAQAATFLYRFAGEPEVVFDGEDTDCLRPMRLALMVGGLTRTEAACAAPHLIPWDIDYLAAAAVGAIDVSGDWDLLFTVALIGRECMTPERVEQLTRLFL